MVGYVPLPSPRQVPRRKATGPRSACTTATLALQGRSGGRARTEGDGPAASGGGFEAADQGAALLAPEHAARLGDPNPLAEVVGRAGHEALGHGTEPPGGAVPEDQGRSGVALQHLEV